MIYGISNVTIIYGRWPAPELLGGLRGTSMSVKSEHLDVFGFVVTSGVSRETSMIVCRVLLQQQFTHHNML